MVTRKTATKTAPAKPRIQASSGANLPARRPSAKAGSSGTTLAALGSPGSTALLDTALLDTADTVANKLSDIAPSFGEILKSIGSGVAKAQRALDDGVISTIKKLSDTKIDVVTDVVQRIDDDTGMPLEPVPSDLIKQQLSVLNFITPSVHEWKYVALSMDMSVSGMDSKTGMTFKNSSFSTSHESKGLFFGFVGVGTTTASAAFNLTHTNIERESEWVSGRVQLDAMLGPRKTTKFPVPASVEIGPQIFAVQGKTTDVKSGVGASAVLVERNVELTITILKRNGEANSGKTPLIVSPGVMREFVGADGSTDGSGKVKYRLRRFYNGGASGFATIPVTVSLGAITRRFEVDL